MAQFGHTPGWNGTTRLVLIPYAEDIPGGFPATQKGRDFVLGDFGDCLPYRLRINTRAREFAMSAKGGQRT